LNGPPRSLLEIVDASEELPTPTTLLVLERAGVRRHFTAKRRISVLDAMRSAASKRTDGVTAEKRRRHYEHAATLVACCAEIDPTGSAAWLHALRTRTTRFPAFQEALRSSLNGASTVAGTWRLIDGE
jgi:hypothetical protein